MERRLSTAQRRSFFWKGIAIGLIVGVVVAIKQGAFPLWSRSGDAQPRVATTPSGELKRYEDGAAVQVGRDDLEQAIDRATRYIVEACDQQGRFRYLLHLDHGPVQPETYNIVRHAGTMYALAMTHQRRPDPQVKDALLRSAVYLKQTIRPLSSNRPILAVWSDPDLNGDEGPLQAKLGGTGLGLVALTQLEHIAPGTTSPDELRLMAEFLLFMQKPDGSFYSSYTPQGGRDDLRPSLYFPGESALALAMLYELDQQPRYVLSAAKAVSYLAEQGLRQDPTLPDHWLLLALEALMPWRSAWQHTVPADLIFEHADRVARDMIIYQRGTDAEPVVRGCLTADGRTCPTSARLEGLQAALTYRHLLDPATVETLDRAVPAAIDFLIRSQVPDGQWAGGFPAAVIPLTDGPPEILEPYNRTIREVRIDFVQHALSALLRYEKAL